MHSWPITVIERSIEQRLAPTVRLACWLACLVLATPGRTLAQDDVRLEAGSRIRVTSPHHSLLGAVGVVRDFSIDTVVVDFEEGQAMLPIARSDITGMDVSLGQRSRTVRGIAIGALAGAALGFGIGFAQGDDPPDVGFFKGPSFSASEKGALFGLAGALVGAAVGKFIGERMFADDWQPHVDARAELFVTPLVGVDQVGFSIRAMSR